MYVCMEALLSTSQKESSYIMVHVPVPMGCWLYNLHVTFFYNYFLGMAWRRKWGTNSPYDVIPICNLPVKHEQFWMISGCAIW